MFSCRFLLMCFISISISIHAHANCSSCFCFMQELFLRLDWPTQPSCLDLSGGAFRTTTTCPHLNSSLSLNNVSYIGRFPAIPFNHHVDTCCKRMRYSGEPSIPRLFPYLPKGIRDEIWLWAAVGALKRRLIPFHYVF